VRVCAKRQKCVSGGPNKNKAESKTFFIYLFLLLFHDVTSAKSAKLDIFMHGPPLHCETFPTLPYCCAFVLSPLHFCQCDRVGAVPLCVCVCKCLGFERANQNAISTGGASPVIISFTVTGYSLRLILFHISTPLNEQFDLPQRTF